LHFKKLSRVLPIILLFLHLYGAGEQVVRVDTSKRGNIWYLRLDVGVPEFQSEYDGIARLKAEPLETYCVVGGVEVPFYYRLFNAFPSELSVEVEKFGKSRVPCVGLVRYREEMCIDGDKLLVLKGGAKVNREVVTKKFLGLYRGAPVTAVCVFPYLVNVDVGEISYYKRLEVKVVYKELVETNLVEEKEDRVCESIFPGEHFLRVSAPESRPVKKVVFPSGRMVKIMVDRDGIYRVTGRDIEKIGVDIDQIDPMCIHLFNRGREVPIFVEGESDGRFNEDDFIEFYAEMKKSDSRKYFYDPFTDKNVYWLSWDDNYGIRYAIEDVSLTKSSEEVIIPRNYLYKVHFEENKFFSRLGYVDIDKSSYERDHWFFDSGILGGTSATYNFTLVYPDQTVTNNYRLTLCMHGLTRLFVPHVVKVYVNNIKVMEGIWEDQEQYIIQSNENAVLFNNYLEHGDNEIQILVEGTDPTQKYDKVLFDWAEIEYYREYRAYDDEIVFTKPHNYPRGYYHFKIKGFTSPEISLYLMNKTKLVNFVVRYDPVDNDYFVVFEDFVAGDSMKYIAVGEDGFKSPQAMELDTLGNALNCSEGDVIIILPEKWANEVGDLMGLYREMGYIPSLVCIEDIYNDFSYGIVSPYAVKDFLRYSYLNWSVKPRYVIFLGDAGLREEKFVPAYFFQSYKFGACASDYWYSLLDTSDIIPDVIVGRIPCHSLEELELYIRKRIDYERERNTGVWRNSVLLISGGLDAFNKQTQYIADEVISKKTFVDKFLCLEGRDLTDSLVRKINGSGYNLVNFFGHGGGAIWSDRSLMTMEDVDRLNNLSMLPMVTSMTCFTGDFTYPTLGKRMLFHENGGAICFLGSSSVGWIINDYLFVKNFYKIVEKGFTFGEAVNYAKIEYLVQNVDFEYLKRSIVFSYNILGDPTVRIDFPEDSVRVSAEKKENSVKIVPEFDISEGVIYFQMYGDDRVPIFKSLKSYELRDFPGVLDIPKWYNGEKLFLTYYLNSVSWDGRGYTLISAGEDFVRSCYTQPALPCDGDSVWIVAVFEEIEVDSIVCLVDTAGVVRHVGDDGIWEVDGFGDEDSVVRLRMRKDDVRWKSEKSFIVRGFGKLLGMKFIAYEGGSVDESDVYTFRIDNGVDLKVLDMTMGVSRLPFLEATVSCDGDGGAKCWVSFYEESGEGYKLLGKKRFVADGSGVYSLRLRGIFGWGRKRFKVVIDKENEVREIDEQNNLFVKDLVVNAFAVIPGLGTTADGKTHTDLTSDSLVFFRVSGENVYDTTGIVVEVYDRGGYLGNQPGFDFVVDRCYGVSFGNPSSVSRIDVFCRDTEEGISLCKYNEKYEKWIVIDQAGSGVFSDRLVRKENIYSIMAVRDDRAPLIEVTANGKHIYDDSFISMPSNISVIIEDDNGVIWDTGFVKILVNDSFRDTSSIALLDYVSSENRLTLQFRSNMKYGRNRIKVIARDVAGNVGSFEVEVNVLKELRIYDYGNFPNPFRDKTVFIYELSQDVEEITIKVFTVSGRLVKVIDSKVTNPEMSVAGYHEVEWDGRDREGNFIANGVYFYKITAKKKGKKVSSQGKIAKVK